MDHQLRLTEHLSTIIMGKTGVDTCIVLSHIHQHQGICGSILLVAEPGAVH
jgi:hypothetical protein